MAADLRTKTFHSGVLLLGAAFLPWLAWVFWLGRNDPSIDPAAHHKWLMRIVVAFAAGALASVTASILLLFGTGWKRVVGVVVGMLWLLFYVAQLLVGD